MKLGKAKTSSLCDDIAEMLYVAIKADAEKAVEAVAPTATRSLGRLNTPLLARQLNELFKKYRKHDVNEIALSQKAYNNFYANMIRLYHVDLMLPPKDQKPSDMCARDRILHRARLLIDHILGPLDLEEWYMAMKMGSGTTHGLKFNDTSLEAKFRFPLTYGSDTSLRIFLDYLQWDNTLNNILDNSYKMWQAKAAMKTKSINTNKNLKIFKRVSHGNLTCVPKTSDDSRVIRLESTVDSFLQLGLMQVMYNRLSYFGLDVETLQSTHGIVAEFGSIFPDLIATLDLKSASDSIMTELVEWLLPQDWFFVISETTQRLLSIPGYEGSFYAPMVATMGNANTFPLQTLVFYAITTATLAECENVSILEIVGDKRIHQAVSVYGDDIICPGPVAPVVIDVLASLGMVVNVDKSHYKPDDFFRESCGSDYFMGRNVRPFHLKRSASDHDEEDFVFSLEAWLYIALNRLYRVYRDLYYIDGKWQYGISSFEDTSLWGLISCLFDGYGLWFKTVPVDFPDDSGFRYLSDLSYLDDFIRFDKIWWNEKEQNFAFKFLKFDFYDTARPFIALRFWDKLKKASQTDFQNLDHLGPDPIKIESIRRALKARGGSYKRKKSTSTRFLWNEME